VLAPLAGAAIVVVAIHVLVNHPLTLLHLVGLMLIFAVGSNYALFFDQRALHAGAGGSRTLASLTLAGTTTLIGFGVLGFSHVPILQAIGATVGPGALLALLFSAVFAGRPAADPTAAAA
jgi:predicted exporter